jgi:hypothetical protein
MRERSTPPLDKPMTSRRVLESRGSRGFVYGQSALAGALRESQPLSRAVAVDGTTPAKAAVRVQAAVERLHTAGE